MIRPEFKVLLSEIYAEAEANALRRATYRRNEQIAINVFDTAVAVGLVTNTGAVLSTVPTARTYWAELAQL